MRFVAAVLLFASGVFAQSATNQARWKPIEFLFGDWTAKGGGTSTGQGAGDFSFKPEVNGQIVVRKNFAEYTSGLEAGTRHDDLMIVYSDAPDGPLRAMYFDSEGHIIHYTITTFTNRVVFESDATQPGPKYRLSYSMNNKTLEGKFEVAPPGAEFKTYLNWSSVKK